MDEMNGMQSIGKWPYEGRGPGPVATIQEETHPPQKAASRKTCRRVIELHAIETTFPGKLERPKVSSSYAWTVFLVIVMLSCLGGAYLGATL